MEDFMCKENTPSMACRSCLLQQQTPGRHSDWCGRLKDCAPQTAWGSQSVMMLHWMQQWIQVEILSILAHFAKGFAKAWCGYTLTKQLFLVNHQDLGYDGGTGNFRPETHGIITLCKMEHRPIFWGNAQLAHRDPIRETLTPNFYINTSKCE
jgi:hypothetical protein